MPAELVPGVQTGSSPEELEEEVRRGVMLTTLGRAVAWARATLEAQGFAALPVLLVIIKNSTLYDGIRHLLFVYPILVAIAAAGWAASQRA